MTLVTSRSRSIRDRTRDSCCSDVTLSVAEMVAEFDRRRQALVQAFATMPGAELAVPRGAFYAFPRITAGGLASEAVAQQLLAEAGVAVVPGSAFGAFGEGHIRISYACAMPGVERGLGALREFLAAQ